MIKRFFVILIGVFFSIAVLNAQDDRYYIKYEETNWKTSTSGMFCNSSIFDAYVHIFLSSGVTKSFNRSGGKTQTHIMYLKPSFFRVATVVGTSGDLRTGFVDRVYTKGEAPFEMSRSDSYNTGCTRKINATYRMTVDDPAKIESVQFENSTDIYSCGTPRIIIKVSPYYNNGKGLANLQVLDDNNVWQTLQTVSGNVTYYLTYAQIARYVSLGKPIKLRTTKTLLDNSYSYSSSTKYLYYLPTFKLPAGKTILTESPVCYGGNTIIRIPYEGTTNYIITISGPDSWSHGLQNIDTSRPDVKKEGGYYVFEEKIAEGTHILKAEYKLTGSDCPQCGCASENLPFEVVLPPVFSLTEYRPGYTGTDNNNKSVQIKEHGGKGSVLFTVSGSRTQNVTVYANTASTQNAYSNNINLTGGSFVKNKITYYSGTASIDLPAGTFDIYVSNSFCKSDTIRDITLSQPDDISFDTATTPPSCNTANRVSGSIDNGTIFISNIRGGIGVHKYSVDGGTGQEITSQNNTVTISGAAKKYIINVFDGFGNKQSKEVTIASPNSITANITSTTAPSTPCSDDATATVSASGGAGNLKYSNEINGYYDSNNVVDGYRSGRNEVYVKDDNNCICSFSFNIESVDQLTVVSVDAIKPTCHGGSDGSCTLVMENRRGTLSVSGLPVSCQTSFSGDTIFITKLKAGVYDFNIIDTHGGEACSIKYLFTVLEKSEISINPTVTRVSDKGSATGSVSIAVSGGNEGDYTVSLFDDLNVPLQEYAGASPFVFSELTGASTGEGKLYKIIVSDSLDCSKEFEVRIPEPADALHLQASIKPASCYGSSDGTVTLSGQYGWEGYEYSKDSTVWTTQSNFTGYSAGTYTFYVRDRYNGSQSITVTIDQPVPLSVTRVDLSHILCKGESIGWIRYKVSGGTYPYSVLPATGTVTESIEEGDTLLTVSRLPAGNYSFTIRDSHNCMIAADKDTIVEPPKLQLANPDITHTTCELDNGALTAQASGGVAPYVYVLSEVEDNSYTQTQTADEGELVSFTELPPGTYRIEVTDNNGCSTSSDLLRINGYENPAIHSAFVRHVTLYEGSNGWVEIIPLIGTANIQTFTLHNADFSYSESNSTGIFENMTAGIYRADVYDENGCMSKLPYPVTVRQPEPLSVVIDTICPSISKGAKEGKIVFKVHGGNPGSKTVLLKSESGEDLDVLFAVDDFPEFFTVYAGKYYLEIIDDMDVTITSELLTVTEPSDILQLIVKEVKDAQCKSQTGSIEVEGTGGWGDYRFKRATDAYYSTLNSFENLYPGSYLITVTDRMGATANQIITVYEPQDSLKAEVTGIIPPTCGNNGGISIRLSGGTSPYQLSDGSSTLSNLQSTVEWTGLASGAVLLHLIDANGCRFELETELPASNQLRIENMELQYPVWSGVNGSISAHIKGGTGPYTCQWEGLTPELSGEEIQAWDNDLLVSELKDIPAGYYKFTVTDAGGCSASQFVYLADPGDMLFELVRTSDETAFEAADGRAVLYTDVVLSDYTLISPQKVVSSYSFIDETELFSVKNDTVYLQNLSPGQWFISGKNVLNEQVIATFEIRPYPEFFFSDTLTIPVSRPGGLDGKIRVEVKGGGGGNRFTWMNEAGTPYFSADNEYSSILQDIPAGRYTVTVEDCYGNLLKKTIEVLEPAAALQLSIVEQTIQSCKDYSDAYVRLSAAGGWGDYQFRHESEKYYNNASSFSGLATGEQYFYLTDKFGVIDSLLVTITEPEYLRASVNKIDSVKCKGGSNGKILFNISGGNPPYSFKKIDAPVWTLGNEATGLNTGFHTFIFTDSNACEGKDTLTVYMPELEELLFKDVQVTHTTCSEDNGKIKVELQGGTRPYYYKWIDFNNQEIGNDSTITDLKQNGLYRLEVTDANGCTQYLEQLIQPSKLPRITSVETTEVLCYGDSTGTARIAAVTAGEPYAPYSFTWSNGDTGEFSNRFEKGQHSVTISDENGCSTTYYFDIGQPDSLRLRISESKEPHCFGYSDGYIRTQTTGGKGNYTYEWSTGETTAHIENLTKGDYWVRVTDENGCMDERHITLNEPDYQYIDLGEDVLMCPGNTHVIDGGNYVSYRWFTDKEDISRERYLSVTKEDRYYLEAKTPDGCSAWGDIGISIGNNALKADMLLASEAAVGDTLIIFELSNLPLDSLKWEYDPAVFEQIPITDEYYKSPYVLQLRCLQTGVYNISLMAYSGGCYAPAVKQIEIVEAEDWDDDWWKAKEPLIQSLTQYPNPTNGIFIVEMELREPAEARFVIFEVASGICVNQRTEAGSDYYNVSYNLTHLQTGVYVLIVTAGNERKQIKIIIE
jgi:hypothetical protein